MPRLTRRGRPPSNENRAAVLDATRAVLAAEGYDRLTLEAVATEAGLYRRYISRTWRSKAELVRDASSSRTWSTS
ncbi:MAG: helix-turn-helix domain-containing protein [Acidimicrobiales bacterium]